MTLPARQVSWSISSLPCGHGIETLHRGVVSGLFGHCRRLRLPVAVASFVYLHVLAGAFPNLALRLLPAMNCLPVPAASLRIEFIGTLSDLRRRIGLFPDFGIRNTPPNHRDLQCVIQNQARDHGINK